MTTRHDILVLFFLVNLLVACGVKSSLQQAPPEKFNTLTLEENKLASLPDPQVNILFVVDNSGSMKGYQAKMAENIELFSNEFFNNPRLDYRIGVVPVYDSRYLDDKKYYEGAGYRKMNALGELVPLKGLSSETSQRFITPQTPNPKEVLKNTVMIGVQWGPEAEESYTPVLAITDPKRNHEINQDFYIPEAHLVVIFLTDADDASPRLSAEDFYNQLVQLKKGDRSKVLIAAALPNLKNKSKSCVTDGYGPIQSFPSLLAVSGGLFADLCSQDFGKTLAHFGETLLNQVATQKISLGFTPDIDSLRVTYGTKNQNDSERQELKRDRMDYSFIPESNEIVINPRVNLKKISGAKIWVSAEPASLANAGNGRLNKL